MLLIVIARDHDSNETIKLFELVLYCTVKSERREEAVGNIMALEETEQQMLMELINGNYLHTTIKWSVLALHPCFE